MSQEIQKSIGKGDWDKMMKRSVPSSASIVDHQFHTVNSEKNKTLTDVINHPKTIKPRKKDATEGISQKLVFDHPAGEHSPVMIKPYHKKLESRGHVSLPITGWATMATKALFNAGGIGHMAEDVTSHEHEGTPLTVHRMSPGFQNIGDKFDWYGKKPKGHANVNPLHVQQVALMDYLANNSDRHTGNLMINDKETNDEGYNPILAIDHERNFQYNMQPNMARRSEKPPSLGDHPSQYIDKDSSPGTYAAARMSYGHHDPHELSEWWKESGPKIREEMNRQMVGVKDPGVRKHIETNFNDRANLLDKWSQNPTELFKPYDPESSPEDQFPKLYMNKFPRKYKEESAKVMQQLPEDPVEAANQILSSSVEMPYKAKNKAILDEVMQDLAEKMSPEQLAGFMYTNHDHPLFNIKKMVQGRNFENPADHAKFANTLRDLADKHPDMKKKFPFIKRIVDKTIAEE